MFSLNHAIAGVNYTDVPSDSTKTKKEIKKMELRINDGSTTKKAEPSKAAPKDLKQVEKSDAKEENTKTALKEDRTTSAPGTPTNNVEKSVSIDELKASTKKETKVQSLQKTNKIPTVSYPYYTGGNVAVREFIRKHQRYPEECKSERLRGRVEVTMTISWDGTPHSPRITKSSGNEYMDAEAMRLADMMPGWNPAEESDDPQSIEYTIFVNFRPGR